MEKVLLMRNAALNKKRQKVLGLSNAMFSLAPPFTGYAETLSIGLRHEAVVSALLELENYIVEWNLGRAVRQIYDGPDGKHDTNGIDMIVSNPEGEVFYVDVKADSALKSNQIYLEMLHKSGRNSVLLNEKISHTIHVYISPLVIFPGNIPIRTAKIVFVDLNILRSYLENANTLFGISAEQNFHGHTGFKLPISLLKRYGCVQIWDIHYSGALNKSA